MTDKKGQAAMEFLLTYGWAILVVLLVIGALSYFGVLNPKQFLPSRCTIDEPLHCVDKQITEDGVVKILVRNGNPNAIMITGFKFVDIEGILSGDQETTGLTQVVASGETMTIKKTGIAIAASKGTKVKVGIVIDYKDQATLFEHSSSGEMLVSVE